MKRVFLLAAMMAMALVAASGISFAANVDCPNQGEDEDGFTCVGTDNDDTMNGSGEDDSMRGLKRDDNLLGNDGEDRLFGDQGEDVVNGGPGDDGFVFGGGGRENAEGKFLPNDSSDDNVKGGGGNDFILGGLDLEKGAADTIDGGSGDDEINVSQRVINRVGLDIELEDKAPVLKEVVDCGPGEDTVIYDEGKDKINKQTCENLFTEDDELPDARRLLPSLDGLLNSPAQ